MSGAVVSPEFGVQLQETVIAVRGGKRKSRERVDAVGERAASAFPLLAVILDGALAAVTNPKNPQSALATICRWSVAAKGYSETSDKIRVYNHSFTAFAVNTFGFAIVIDGHHCFFGDCQAMSGTLRGLSGDITPP